jgi:hypothetical protein
MLVFSMIGFDLAYICPMIDQKFIDFINDHHVLTLSTVKNGQPYTVKLGGQSRVSLPFTCARYESL